MKSVMMYHPMDSVRTLADIDRLIGSFFDSPMGEGQRRGTRYPAVDAREVDDAYILEAALPGRTEKDVEVNVNGNALTIESRCDTVDEKKEKADGVEGTYILRERHGECFSRSFKLPENADAAQITADFQNGLLTLTIKKRTESQKRVIEIISQKR
jgi:HSP20 family protein